MVETFNTAVSNLKTPNKDQSAAIAKCGNELESIKTYLLGGDNRMVLYSNDAYNLRLFKHYVASSLRNAMYNHLVVAVSMEGKATFAKDFLEYTLQTQLNDDDLQDYDVYDHNHFTIKGGGFGSVSERTHGTIKATLHSYDDNGDRQTTSVQWTSADARKVVVKGINNEQGQGDLIQSALSIGHTPEVFTNVFY